jgi:PAS domain S-box-containing protein
MGFLDNFKKQLSTLIFSRPKVTGWLVFFLSLFLTLYLSYTEYQLKLAAEREEVMAKLNELENKFDGALNNGVSAAKTLGFFAQNQGDFVENFEKIGKDILDSNPLVDVIQYLNGGTIVAVYPLEGNEAVLNYNVLADPNTKKEVEEAINRREVFFSGPLKLRQGGMGIVGRYPVFENYRLKGLSAIIIHLETIFEQGLMNHESNSKFSVQLSKKNPNTGVIENFIPEAGDLKPSGFRASLPIESGNWILSVQLKKSNAVAGIIFLISLSVLLSALFGFLAWSSASQPALLEKKLEEQSSEILKANERFELATRATSDVVWDWDIVRDKIYRSDQFFKFLGYEDSVQIGNNDFFRTIIHPEDFDAVTKKLDETLAGKGEFWENEFRVRKVDNSYAYIIDKGYILRDPQGKAIRMIGAIQDISKRKETEMELFEANKRLGNANEELKAFAFLASHDMREPLRMITSFMALLQKKYSSQLDEKANQYIDFAVDGARRLTTLINDLLEYSKVGFDQKLIEKINTNQLIREILKFKSDIIRESNAEVIIEDLPDITGIRIPIQILFQNLIGNALKYKNSDKTPVIRISGRIIKDFLEFSIEDNGIGIEAEYLEHIFGILNRLHPKEKYPGTGMGLATCRKIVTQHGGIIWADSRIGDGSKFVFTLKLYE